MVIFFFHVAAAFSNQSVVQVLYRVHIPVYFINKLQSFYRGILTSWVQLKGINDNGSYLVRGWILLASLEFFHLLGSFNRERRGRGYIIGNFLVVLFFSDPGG